MCRTCRVIIRHNRFYHCSYFFNNPKTLRKLTVGVTESAWKDVAVLEKGKAVAKKFRTRASFSKLSMARHGIEGEDGDKGNNKSE